MIARHCEAIYCDDVRQEVSGKLTFVGVYSGNMIVVRTPTALPKLCVFVKIITPIGEPLGTHTVQVLHDDKVIGELRNDGSTLERDTPNDATHAIRSVVITVSPFEVTDEGQVKVRVVLEDGSELAAPALRIEVAAPPSVDERAMEN